MRTRPWPRSRHTLQLTPLTPSCLDDGRQLGMAGRVEKEEPFARIAVSGRVRQVGAEDVMLDQGPLDALEVEEHPEIKRRQVKDGRAAPHEVVGGVRVAAHA